MPKSADYWKTRFEQIEQSQHKKAVVAYSEIEAQYRAAQKEIEKQIRAWYQRFADNNEITLAEAKKLLSSKELEELKWDVQDYIKYGEQNALNGGQWAKQLENASAKFHISRLEALKLHTQQAVESMFANQYDTVDSTMRNLYKSGYYRTAYEIQRGCNVGWDFATLDEKQISKVINKPWAADGSNFSERIWNNRQKLVDELDKTLTRNIVLAQDPQKAIDEIARKMNTSKVNAGRLVMTEEAYFSSEAQKDCFNELDVEMYEIVATLDSHTSEICQDMDGKHFKMSEWAIGVTAPPFHVNCRTTTVPYFDDEFDNIGERAARDANGKTYYVPGNTTYKEWSKGFIEGDKSGFEEAKPEQIEQPKVEQSKAPETPVNPENRIEVIEDKARGAVRDAYEYKRTVTGANLVPWDELDRTDTVSLKGMSPELAEVTATRFDMLQNKYETNCDNIKCIPFDWKLASVPAETNLQPQLSMATITFNRNVVKNQAKFTERMKAAVDRGHFPQMEESMFNDYLITHEYAHSMMDFSKGTKSLVGVDLSKLKSARKEVEAIQAEYLKEYKALEAKAKAAELKALESFDDTDWKEAQRLSAELKDLKISEYAEKDINEFWAEAFTDAEIGSNPSPYSKKVQAVAEKYFGKNENTNRSYSDIDEEYQINIESIRKTLHEVEESTKDVHHEVGTILNTKGEIINITEGLSNKVSPPAHLLKNNIFTHNHPNGSCFSDNDIGKMIEDEVLELRAHTPQGIYYSLYRLGAVPEDDKFYDEFVKASGVNALVDRIREMMKSGIVDRTDLSEELYMKVGDELAITFLEKNAEKYGYRFSMGVI